MRRDACTCPAIGPLLLRRIDPAGRDRIHANAAIWPRLRERAR